MVTKIKAFYPFYWCERQPSACTEEKFRTMNQLKWLIAESVDEVFLG